MTIGCDFHPSWEQIAWLDTETGETGERKLVHADGEAERFYRQLPPPAWIPCYLNRTYHVLTTGAKVGLDSASAAE